METQMVNVPKVDKGLVEKFKALCKIKEISMRQAIINLIKISVKSQKIPN